LRRKKTPELLEDAENCLEAEKHDADLEKLVKISLRESSQEERVQEASRPLYLRRYE
jgi:hypothetical protein